MIASFMPVHFIDIDEGVDYKQDAEFLFSHYAHKMIHHQCRDMIDLSNDNVKIKDFNGWTQILKIEKWKSHEWLLLYPCQEGDLNDLHKIIVSPNTLVPAYDIDDIIRGFHGEVKIGFKLKRADELSSDDKIRFTKVFKNIDSDLQLSSVGKFPIIREAVGYDIYTKSKFFNADTILLYGDKDVNISTKIAYK